ncbi:hypothetical protein, partial [Helicobacter sp. 13S00482-2]|uniref:hypothetical protein n=1 Tax=Helicobacter sp. 13S00482-2 TaxID=1476200 RepID=UPI0011798A70
MTTMNFLRTILHISAKNTDVSDNYSLGGGGSDLLKAPSSHSGNTNQFSSTERFQSNLNCNTISSEVDANARKSRNESSRFSGDFHNHSSAKEWDSFLACSAQASLDEKKREGFLLDGTSRPNGSPFVVSTDFESSKFYHSQRIEDIKEFETHLNAKGSNPDGTSRPVNPKSSKKAFFPLFSLVLSTLLLPFTADIAQAALSSSDIRLLSADHGNLNRPEVYSSGDARCLLSGDKACGRVTQSFANMFNITKNSTYSDVYYLKYNYNIG